MRYLQLLLILLPFFIALMAEPSRASSNCDLTAQVLDEAITLSRQVKQNRAIRRLKEFICLNPNLAQPHQMLGVILATDGDTASGINELKTAIKLDPDLFTSWLNLGAVYQSLGQPEEAIATYDDFLKRFSGNDMHDQILELRDNLYQETRSFPPP